MEYKRLSRIDRIEEYKRIEIHLEPGYFIYLPNKVYLELSDDILYWNISKQLDDLTNSHFYL